MAIPALSSVDQQQPQPGYRESVKVALASLIGTSIEWYDFFLYGTAAALVFNKLFFPTFDPLVGTIAAFATFAVGFIARPIGGIVFGHYGDRIGRKNMLYLTLLIMGTATAIIGLLPTYATIGIWAPVLLVTMRLAQGFGLGGEWGGAVLMAVEHAPANRRGFYGSWPQIGAYIGLLLSTLVFRYVSKLPEEVFLSWAWRVPFLLSFLLVGVGLWIRMKVSESPVFEKVKQQKHESRLPIVEVLKKHPKNMLLAAGARFAENGLFYIFTTFALTYVATQLKMDRVIALNGLLVASFVNIFLGPLWGALSDRIGRRPVYIWGAVACGLLAFPFFWMLGTKQPALIWLAIALPLGLGHAAMYGPQASFFSELFSARLRYSGASLGYQLASVFAGGLSPLIATGLLAWADGKPWPIAVYMIVLVVITVISVALAAETHRNTIEE
ncbi:MULTISPECIES: MFS transporter [unclassified Anaeromyxobacter]|uniref:MFS transporter n=1 Tax=unclassified Anaeromyxobacter TaxID=2620896 RepID=UPI001F59E4DC|nr:MULTISPECIES: MFS transporter [unclassified Anaeromyxobacter]